MRLARPATFVLERQHLDDVLATFRREESHLALATDEYGQIAGLLTLEDVLEELVGEIKDEYDAGEEVPIRQQADGSWVVEGGEPYEHVREVVGLPPIPPHERGLYLMLPGLLMVYLGSVPARGDVVEFGQGVDRWAAEVVALEGRRVTLISLRRLPHFGSQDS